MIERDARELLETLHARLSAIQKAIQDSKSAIEDAANSRQKAVTDKEGRIVVSIVPPDDEYRQGSTTYKHKGIGPK